MDSNTHQRNTNPRVVSMKYLSSFVFLCCFASLSFASKPLMDYDAEQVAEHTYVIHGPLETPNPKNRGFMNNPAFIIADKGVIVIDPGSSYEAGSMVLRNIRKLTDKPVTHVFNTHVHGDHWLGNDAMSRSYPDAVIFADPRMIKKAKAGEGQNWIELMMRTTDGATRETRLSLPNRETQHSDELKIHNFNFRIHSVGIGHSNTDIMIEFVEDSVLFTGDNVAYKRVLRMDDGHFKDNIAACDHAIGLNLKHYVPGHGPAGDVSLVKAQKRYFEILYREVGKGFDEGLSDFEIKPQAVQALADYQHWAGFDLEVGKHVSLVLLEIEKSEFQ